MKFIYIADTHIGGSDRCGYRQQERYLRYFDELIEVFANWIINCGDVDFIIHGGDMVDEASPDNIKTCVELFNKLPCPVYLALGNHDLTDADSVEKWLSVGNAFFNGKEVDFSFSHGKINFDFLSCHWGATPYFWDPAEPQIPYLETEQLDLINSGREEQNHRILITHAPVFGLPCMQSGFDEELHPSLGNFNEVIRELAAKNKLLMVLGAHTHMNMHINKAGTHYVTASAFSESPFEFKLFELSDECFSMKTVSLADETSFKYKYDFNKTYIQGRDCDRSFKEML